MPHSMAGQRGHAVLVQRGEAGIPRFILEFRCVETGKEQLIFAKTPACLSEQLVLSYGPWCGKELAKWYRPQVDNPIRERSNQNQQ
jgi:hypothetical protein